MSKTLLLADDSVTIQRVIELTFAHEDIRVVSVSDGRRAVQWLENDRPDIVLTDVDVPEVDGYELAQFIRQSPRLQQVPVLLLAGAFEPVDQDRVQEIGCDGVLVKPFEPQQLVSRVKELLARANGSAPAAGSAQPRGEARRHGDGEPATVTPFPTPAQAQAPAAGMRMAQAGLESDEPPEPLEPPTRPVWELGLPDPIHGTRPIESPGGPAPGAPAGSPGGGRRASRS